VPSQLVCAAAPELMVVEIIFITNPTKPIAPMPSKLILIESQSSSLPGFVASFSVLPA
jgi:hypothetical protein